MNANTEQRPTRATATIEEVGAALGISRSTAYQLARRDALPVRVIRLGRRLVVPRADLDRLLGLAPAGDAAPDAVA